MPGQAFTSQRPSASTASPFGLVTDLGAAVAVELGIPLHQIEHSLALRTGAPVGSMQARAAIQRGRVELLARRARPEHYRPRPLPKPPAAPSSPVADLPHPREIPDADQHELLLLWAERSPSQRAKSLAAKARAVLDEIAVIRRDGSPRQKRRTARRPAAAPRNPRTAGIPAGEPASEKERADREALQRAIDATFARSRQEAAERARTHGEAA
jgi:hypothetical protein